MLLSEGRACFGAGMLVPLQGAAAEYRYRVLQGAAWMLLSEWCACFGAGMLVGCCCRVLLAGAAVRVACALWGAPAGRVLLEGVLLSALWSMLGSWCRCKVLLLERVVCALELGCWCRWRVPLPGAAEGCC